MKKIVFSEKAKESLPGYIKLTMQRFEAQKVWIIEGHPPLPPACEPNPRNEDNEAMRYASYCQDMLDAGLVDAGKGKSMLVGLKGCGKEGERISELIKKKVLRR